MIGGARIGRAVTIFVQDEPSLASDGYSPLIDLLDHPALRVRAAAVEAVTRLPLERAEWTRVADYAMRALDKSRPLMERQTVLRGAPWMPLRRIRRRVRQIALDEADTGLQADA